MEKIVNYINLQNGEEDKKKVLENVTSNVSFRGSNLWILACAIVVASVGLNVNSTAVIIGAMLISPLMGPIVGAGFALGTYDFQLLKKSVKNLLVATLVSLSISSLYFFISPFKETQSELLARTSPNIYDVLIAFFGGLVGVIAMTRVEKGNPIPGVAIATALMPPLCTAGYGLSIGNMHYFFGAVYLYSINCFFICLSTFLIVKYLKYPLVKQLNAKHGKLVHTLITTCIVIMIIPSCYLAYNLLNEKKYSQKVETFITNEFLNKGYTLIYKKTSFNSDPKKIELAFLTKKFRKNELEELNRKLTQYNIPNTQLEIKQDNSNLKNDILNELNKQNNTASAKDVLIHKLQQELSWYTFKNKKILNEIEILFPEITEVSIGKQISGTPTDSTAVTTVLLYRSEKQISAEMLQRLHLWLEQKLETKNIAIVKQEETH